MRPTRVVLGLLILIAGVCLVAPPGRAEPAQAKPAADRERELEERVADLVGQNATLRKDLAEARRKLKETREKLAERERNGILRIDSDVRITPAPMPGYGAPGRGWVEREFNGEPYYVIPLER